MAGSALRAPYFRNNAGPALFPPDLNHVELLHVPRERCAHFISKIIMLALAREHDNLAATSPLHRKFSPRSGPCNAPTRCSHTRRKFLL